LNYNITVVHASAAFIVFYADQYYPVQGSAGLLVQFTPRESVFDMNEIITVNRVCWAVVSYYVITTNKIFMNWSRYKY